MPIHADYALIKAHKADELGNLTYRLAARNFNPIMAMAAKTTIAEVEEIVPVGTIDPEHVMTPGDLRSSHRASERTSLCRVTAYMKRSCRVTPFSKRSCRV